MSQSVKPNELHVQQLNNHVKESELRETM